MLAAVAPTVKFPASRSPEQAALDQSLSVFWTLVERLHAAADQHQPIHQVEETIFRDLLVMGRSLLQAFLASAGEGDIGPTLTVLADYPSDPPRVVPRLDRIRPRPYLSIFGEISIARACYGEGRIEAAPLDARLHLPRRQYSYLLQQWLAAFVVDDAHAGAIKKIATVLGLGGSGKAPPDLNREEGSGGEPFPNHLR